MIDQLVFSDIESGPVWPVDISLYQTSFCSCSFTGRGRSYISWRGEAVLVFSSGHSLSGFTRAYEVTSLLWLPSRCILRSWKVCGGWRRMSISHLKTASQFSASGLPTSNPACRLATTTDAVYDQGRESTFVGAWDRWRFISREQRQTCVVEQPSGLIIAIVLRPELIVAASTRLLWYSI